MPLINGKMQPNQPGQATTTTSPVAAQAASPAATASSALGAKANVQRNAAASTMNKPGLEPATAGVAPGQNALAQNTPGVAGAGIASAQVEQQQAAAAAAREKAAGGNGDDASTLFGQDLLDQMKAGDAKAEEANAFRTKMMERQALAQAGRQNRMLTGGGGQGMWMQANIMGQHLGDQTMLQREDRYNMMALDVMKQRENNQRWQSGQDQMATQSLAQMDDWQLMNAAKGGDEVAQEMMAQRSGRSWDSIKDVNIPKPATESDQEANKWANRPVSTGGGLSAKHTWTWNGTQWIDEDGNAATADRVAEIRKKVEETYGEAPEGT